eukprot:TRINITY_DN3489_c0_g1_i1.p1 TRINITY_DN3489_c0_g1~~TRINITY_DN3489_c0_g1_i1.p1  ORF type:complete len:247 (+),score=33.96 TRINITY_DN3489_c0_g1_i1:134-874(+)
MFEDEDYCLENTISFLRKKFPHDNIIIIRPARVQGYFSCFDNLLAPGHTLLQLSALLYSFYDKIQELKGITVPEDHPIVITAFSRGVEILNHYLAEYTTLTQNISGFIVDWQNHTANGSALIDVGSEKSLVLYKAKKSSEILFSHREALTTFISRVQEIHYLDGHRYPTHPLVCQSIAELSQKIPIFIHLTPRQQFSETQKFIGQELSAFQHAVDNSGGFLRQKHYLQNSPKTLETHFRILKEFKL